MEIPQLPLTVPGLHHPPGEQFSSGVQPEPPKLQLVAVVPHRVIWHDQGGFSSIIVVVGCSRTPFTSSWPG